MQSAWFQQKTHCGEKCAVTGSEALMACSPGLLQFTVDRVNGWLVDGRNTLLIKSKLGTRNRLSDWHIPWKSNLTLACHEASPITEWCKHSWTSAKSMQFYEHRAKRQRSCNLHTHNEMHFGAYIYWLASGVQLPTKMQRPAHHVSGDAEILLNKPVPSSLFPVPFPFFSLLCHRPSLTTHAVLVLG